MTQDFTLAKLAIIIVLIFTKGVVETFGVNSGVAKLRHTGARAPATRGCAPPCTSAGAPEKLLVPNVRLSIANWALKVHKGVGIELRSIAICTFRITRSRMLP